MFDSTPVLSLFVPKPQGTRWAIGDIHGCYRSLVALVEDQIRPQQGDQLFFLGDYIDRGPDSGAVIDYILELKQAGLEIYTLRGNHEQMLLDLLADGDEMSLRFQRHLQYYNCVGMCDEEGYLQARYVRFMDNLLHYVELDDYFLVHGAFDFNSATPFATPKAMLWSKTHRHNPQMMGHKRLVHGHSTRTLEAILAAIAARAMVIPVDGGCAYTDTKRGLPNGSLGYLCAFNLDTWELRSQKNTESSI